MAIVDKTAAREYLEACVEEAVHAGIARDKAETIERTNILEFARRYPKTVQYRVQTLRYLGVSQAKEREWFQNRG